MRELELLSVVALLEDISTHGLLRGQVGSVVEQLSVPSDQLLQLHHEPSHQAA
jgi:hypothetical protein